MTIKEFEECLMAKLKAKYDNVEIKTVFKNGRLKKAILIKASERVSPTFYLNRLFEFYNECSDFDEILAFIDAELQKTPNFDFDCIYHPREVMVCVCDGSEVEDFLDTILCREIDNTGLYFYFRINAGKIDSSLATCIVTKTLAESANFTFDSLWEIADKDGITVDMDEMLAGEVDITAEDIPEIGMTIVTNQQKLYGAAMAFIPGFLEKHTREDSLVILPSSVHETIFLEDRGGYQNYKRMVLEVNSTSVSEEEKLSDSVFLWKRNCGFSRVA